MITARSFARAALAASIPAGVLAGCTSGAVAPTATPGPYRGAQVAFHAPRSPRDAAVEFVRALATDDNGVVNRLTCTGRPSYVSWPMIISTSNSTSATPARVEVAAVHRTASGTWHISVRAHLGDAADFRVRTTVVRNHGSYQVCSAEAQ